MSLIGGADICYADKLSCRIYDELKGHNNEIASIAFSPKGSYMASADSGGTIITWDLKTEGKMLRKFTASLGNEGAMVFSQDEQYLFCGGKDNAVHMWGITDGSKIREFSMNQPIKSLAISPDNRTLMAGGSRGGIVFWDIKTGKEIKEIMKAHDKRVMFSTFTDQDSIRSVGEDHKMKSWNMNRSDSLAASVDETSYEITSGACNATMDICAVGATVVRMQKGYKGIDEFYNIYLKDGISWAKAGTLKGHDLPIHALAFTNQGDYLASGGDGKKVNIWNMQSSQIEADIAYGAKVSALCFSPDGNWLAVGGDNKLVTLYELKGIAGAKEIPESIMISESDDTPGEKYAVVVGLSKFMDINIDPLNYTVLDAKAFYDFLISEKG